MTDHPVVDASQRATPHGGAPGALRFFAVAQVVLALGTAADWIYGGLADPTKLASSIGFALMAPWSWMAARSSTPAHASLFKPLSVLGIALALGAIVARWI